MVNGGLQPSEFVTRRRIHHAEDTAPTQTVPGRASDHYNPGAMRGLGESGRHVMPSAGAKAPAEILEFPCF